MIQITWVEIFLTGWLMATLAFSIGFCILHYKKSLRMDGFHPSRIGATTNPVTNIQPSAG